MMIAHEYEENRPIIKANDRVFTLKSRRGKLVRIVREKYVRNDIACHSIMCEECTRYNEMGYLDLSSHYIIPDIKTCIKYISIFENHDIKNVIFTDTLISLLKYYGQYKDIQRLLNDVSQSEKPLNMMKRIKTIVSDVKRHCVLFSSDHFKDVSRLNEEIHENMIAYHDETIRKAYLYYKKHLEPYHIDVIYIQSDEERIQSHHDDKILTMGQYISKYFKGNEGIIDLYESIHSDISMKDDEKVIYEEYKDSEVLESGYKSGLYHLGKVNVQNEEYTVQLINNTSNEEYSIPNKTFRNRCIHGDLVYIEIISDNEDKKHCKVVGIYQRARDEYVCTLSLTDDKQRYYDAIPLDYRIPKIRIKTNQANYLSKYRILIRLDEWDRDSIYPRGHYVRVIGDIDDLETHIKSLFIEYDINDQLTENELQKEEEERIISSHTLSAINSKSKHSIISPLNKEGRRDIREWTVFSVDPLGTEDVDDALSCFYDEEKGHYVIGVHISDVNAFVEEDSMIDINARMRGTTVYLPNRRIDMLPKILSSDLCSLRENVDRYAMSVIMNIDEDGNVKGFPWIGRTIVRNCCEIDYETGDKLMNQQYKQINNDKVMKHERLQEIKKSLDALRRIFRIKRKERVLKGAIQINSYQESMIQKQNELKFIMDEKGNVKNIYQKDRLEIHDIIEEYMIIANHYVAKYLYKQYPNGGALLRIHESKMNKNKMNDIIQLYKKRIIKDETVDDDMIIDLLIKEISSNQAIMKDPLFSSYLKHLLTTSMSEAKYISSLKYDDSTTLSSYHHYGLGLDFYTHFTSPIRRYSDTMVHRLIIKTLEDKSNDNGDISYSIHKLCDHLNEKNTNSKRFQRELSQIYTSLYFKYHQSNHNISHTHAIITKIRKNHFHLFIPQFNLKGSILFRDLSFIQSLFTDTSSLHNFDVNHDIIVDQDSDSVHFNSPISQSFNLFDTILISIHIRESRYHLPSIQFSFIKRISSSHDIIQSSHHVLDKSRIHDMIHQFQSKLKLSSSDHHLNSAQSYPPIYQTLLSFHRSSHHNVVNYEKKKIKKINFNNGRRIFKQDEYQNYLDQLNYMEDENGDDFDTMSYIDEDGLSSDYRSISIKAEMDFRAKSFRETKRRYHPPPKK